MLKTNEIQIRDPFVLRVDDEKRYYLFGSTEKNPWDGKATGFDAYWGADLENWEGPFPVFRPAEDFWSDKNFWAPEVHFYQGRYYMFASFKSDDRCRAVQILVSEAPSGPYVPYTDGPVTPPEWECLDGTLYVDEFEEPWMVFCHEWVQVQDGETCLMKLSKDLKKPVGQPMVLFSASSAPWTCPNTGNIEKEGKNYVTDGPFLFKNRRNVLCMLWSSFTEKGYAIGVARSESGNIKGPWIHDKAPVYNEDGGHGMLFKTFDGRLLLSIHSPNTTPFERPKFIEMNQLL